MLKWFAMRIHHQLHAQDSLLQEDQLHVAVSSLDLPDVLMVLLGPAAPPPRPPAQQQTLEQLTPTLTALPTQQQEPLDLLTAQMPLLPLETLSALESCNAPLQDLLQQLH